MLFVSLFSLELPSRVVFDERYWSPREAVLAGFSSLPAASGISAVGRGHNWLNRHMFVVLPWMITLKVARSVFLHKLASRPCYKALAGS